MDLIADILLIAGALGAAFYCVVLSRRLARFNDLEKGVGGAIAVLSAQVDDMTRTLKDAQGTARGSTAALEGLTDRADGVAKRLELLVASMHDLPEVAEPHPDPAADSPTTAWQDAPHPAPEPARDHPAPAVEQAGSHPDPADPGMAAEVEETVPAIFRSQRGWVREAAE
jgi:hypothetical protein